MACTMRHCADQDTVAGLGRKGSRPLCVAAARAALLAGHGAIIDRCNWDIPQRRDFVALAIQLNCQVPPLCVDSPLFGVWDKAFAPSSLTTLLGLAMPLHQAFPDTC